MFGPRIRCASAKMLDMLPRLLLVVLCLLTVVWFSPGLPYPEQDSAWVLALNQAVADRLSFGRDVIYPLGPWGNVYAGQYHPATDGIMLAGGTIVALALAFGLSVLARGRRRWVVLLAPLLVATVGERDPVFIAMPLLLLAVAITVARPASAGLPDEWPGRWGAGAILILTISCALLTLIKGTFGTQAASMVGLAGLALLSDRRFWLAALMLACYAMSLVGFWLLAGQHLVDLPAYITTMPVVIAVYAEGLALDGPPSDIAAYLCGVVALLWLLWRDRPPGERGNTLLLLLGLLCTLFVAFKVGLRAPRRARAHRCRRPCHDAGLIGGRTAPPPTGSGGTRHLVHAGFHQSSLCGLRMALAHPRARPSDDGHLGRMDPDRRPGAVAAIIRCRYGCSAHRHAAASRSRSY